MKQGCLTQVCFHCRCDFVPSPRVKNQRYCGKEDCRRAWKRDWQRQKMAKDAEYRANQERAQRAWRKRHPDYWREYRARKAREALREGGCTSPSPEVGVKMDAKMDSIPPGPPFPGNADAIIIPPGLYRLSPLIDGVAKMDSIIVEIRSICVE